MGLISTAFGVTWERRNGTHKLSGTLRPGDSVCLLERLVLRYNRRLKKFVQQGRSNARRRGVPLRYVELLSDARTMLADFFTIRLVMRVQKFRVRMLVVEFGEVAMDGFGVAAFGFELNGQMFDFEFTGDPVADCLEEVGR